MIEKVFTIWPESKEIPAEYQACIDHNIAFYAAQGIPFEVIRECPYDLPTTDKYRNITEYERVLWLLDHPTWQWVDADAKAIKPLDIVLKPDTLYLINRMGGLDTHVMIANGAVDMLQELANYYRQHEPLAGWPVRYLNDKLNRIGVIPNPVDMSLPRYFYHKSLFNHNHS